MSKQCPGTEKHTGSMAALPSHRSRSIFIHVSRWWQCASIALI